MDITGLAGVAVLALAKQMMDLLKYLSNREWNGVLTIVAAWIVGTVTVLLVSFTTLGKGDIFGVTLAHQGIYGRVILGMIVGSATGLAHETLKAIRKQGDPKPPLFPGLVKPASEPVVVESPAVVGEQGA